MGKFFPLDQSLNDYDSVFACLLYIEDDEVFQRVVVCVEVDFKGLSSLVKVAGRGRDLKACSITQDILVLYFIISLFFVEARCSYG